MLNVQSKSEGEMLSQEEDSSSTCWLTFLDLKLEIKSRRHIWMCRLDTAQNGRSWLEALMRYSSLCVQIGQLELWRGLCMWECVPGFVTRLGVIGGRTCQWSSGCKCDMGHKGAQPRFNWIQRLTFRNGWAFWQKHLTVRVRCYALTKAYFTTRDSCLVWSLGFMPCCQWVDSFPLWWGCKSETGSAEYVE